MLVGIESKQIDVRVMNFLYHYSRYFLIDKKKQ